ncbi:MAG: HicB family protein [Thiotrichaceae bacterium IS1]|nr:MAG: HicB family protein [Thiotrichaceae bacterium IS1]
MLREFTLEYWQDDGWYVGRLKEIPNVFSQGETLEELQDQIKDAYQLLLAESSPAFRHDTQQLAIEVEV